MRGWCEHHVSGHKDLSFHLNIKCQELHLLGILAPTSICSPQELPRSLSTSMPAGPWIHVLCSHYLARFFIAQYLYVSVYVMPLALSFLHFGWKNSNPVVFCMGRIAYLKYSRVRFRRRQWHPTPVLLPGKSHGRRSLVGCSPWGRWGSDTTERLHVHFSLSCIGEGNGSPLQCSCLKNPRDGGAWWAAVYGVTHSRTRLKWLSLAVAESGLEKEMATHSSVLAWRIPGMGEPGGLSSMGLHRVGHDWSDLAAATAAESGYEVGWI